MTRAINYNGQRVIYNESNVEHFDFFEGEEILTFTFTLNGKTVLKFQDTL